MSSKLISFVVLVAVLVTSTQLVKSSPLDIAVLSGRSWSTLATPWSTPATPWSTPATPVLGAKTSSRLESNTGKQVLTQQHAQDLLTPLEINLADITYWWKVYSASAHHESTDSNVQPMRTAGDSYALPILNDRLPAPLVECFTNMTKSEMERGVYSPAAYGDRLCGELQRTEVCVVKQEEISPGVGDRTATPQLMSAADFVYELRLTRAILCDPECPFAQAQSCNTDLIQMATKHHPLTYTDTTGQNELECRLREDTISCTDMMLKDLECKPSSKANVYWLRAKTLGRLKSCGSARCIAPVEKCLTPLTQYLSHRSIDNLCRLSEQMAACVSDALLKCGDNSNNHETFEIMLREIVCRKD